MKVATPMSRRVDDRRAHRQATTDQLATAHAQHARWLKAEKLGAGHGFSSPAVVLGGSGQRGTVTPKSGGQEPGGGG